MMKMAKKDPSPRQRAWQSMRIISRWTMEDMESTAEIKRANLDKYVGALIKAGYVHCITPRKSGVKGGYAWYQLVKNTGPRCPLVKNYYSVVLDQNTGECTTIGLPKRAKKQRDNSPNRFTRLYPVHKAVEESEQHEAGQDERQQPCG